MLSPKLAPSWPRPGDGWSNAAAAEGPAQAPASASPLGGVPTYVPFERQAPNGTVGRTMGPTKLTYAAAWPRSLRLGSGCQHLEVLPGKRYDGEVNPRWRCG